MLRSNSYNNIDEKLIKRTDERKNLTWSNSVSMNYYDTDAIPIKYTAEYESGSSPDSLNDDIIINNRNSHNYMYLSGSVNYSKHISDFNSHTAIPVYKVLNAVNRIKQMDSDENLAMNDEDCFVEPITSGSSNTPNSDDYYYSIPCSEHRYVNDCIDIDPDNSMCVRYCEVCGYTDI